MWRRSDVKQGLDGAADELLGDEADVHEGLRTHFPLSFGKQEAKSVTLESIHSKTKRGQALVADLSSLVGDPCLFLFSLLIGSRGSTSATTFVVKML